MTTLCTCIKITRSDETVEGYTDHDKDLTVSGVNYLSSAGFFPSAIERNSELKSNNQSITGVINNDNISSSDIRAGIYDGSRVEMLLVDWSTEILDSKLLVGFFGPATIEGSQYTIELHSIESELKKSTGRSVEIRCDADLGDTRCGYTLVADTGSVSGVTTAKRVIVDSTRTEVDGFFDGGKLTWTSGENIGRTMDVKKYTLATKTIELFEPMPSDIAVSDEFDIYQGCDKTIKTCIETFSNGERFRGFPYLPGSSNLVSGNT